MSKKKGKGKAVEEPEEDEEEPNLIDEAEFDMAELEGEMESALERLKQELATLRIGRASPDVLDPISINYHGTPTPVRSLASVRVGDSLSLVLSPFESSTAELLQAAISNAGLGFGCTIDAQGKLVVRIPKPTKESRSAMVKQVQKLGEKTKINIRNVRQDGLKALKPLTKELSKDEMFNFKKELQDLCDQYTEKVDVAVSLKEKEVLG